MGPAALGAGRAALPGACELLWASIAGFPGPGIVEAAPQLCSCASGLDLGWGAPQGAAGIQGSAVPGRSPAGPALGLSAGAALLQPELRCHTGAGWELKELVAAGPFVLGAHCAFQVKDREERGGSGRVAGTAVGCRGVPGCAPLGALLLQGPCSWQGCPGPGAVLGLGGGRFPGKGRLRSWLGNVGVSGQGGPGPARAAGGLFLLAGGFQQELRQQPPARLLHSQGSS